jgi:hypothetical protein
MVVSGNRDMTYRTSAIFALPSPAKESSPAISNTDGSATPGVDGLEPFKMSGSQLTIF